MGKNSFACRALALFVGIWAGLSACSEDTPASVPSGTEADKYCLMFYVAGGDTAHDYTLRGTLEEAAAESAGCERVAVTGLFSASGEAEGAMHTGIYRYTVADGRLVEDEGFQPGEDFHVTDPVRLSEFIRWSAKLYPGRKYLLVFAGHGLAWMPDYDLPKTRATLADGNRMMSSAEFATGVRGGGVKMEALIANSCQQGSVETLAEWEGVADYLLGSPLSIPDLGHDYRSLVIDLEKGIGVEQALANMAQRTIDVWAGYASAGLFDEAVTVTRLSDLSPLWRALGETFAYMTGSLDEPGYSTDAPAVTGDPCYLGYYRAFDYVWQMVDATLVHPDRKTVVDLPSYLHAAVVQSGNRWLATCVNRVEAALDSVVVAHLQTDGRRNHLYNVCYADYLFTDDSVTGGYRTCRFDNLTGWSAFRCALQERMERDASASIGDE